MKGAVIILPRFRASTANCAYTARIVRKWMLALILCGASVIDAAAQPSVTFSRDVAPILYTRCASCHRDGGDAPFSLITYDEVSGRARTIDQVTRTRYMPPWKPTPESAAIAGERRLSD